MIGTASGLHPIRAPLANADIRFVLQDAARPGEVVAVECTYRPRREWDVIKERHFHLFGSIWGGSRDMLSVHREEAHTELKEARANGTSLSFSVPLHPADEAHQKYQLESVRVGRLVFESWFPDVPALDSGFGLDCAADSLRGRVRVSGLGAQPLAGMLPLWPSLRNVDVVIAREEPPALVLWDSQAKRHSQGWRQAVPQFWPGGQSILTRHIDGPTVWRDNEYYVILPTRDARITRPSPPEDALPGVRLEVFWPEGKTLEFPETHFERPVTVIPLRMARLTPLIRELLARSASLRPGLEMNSVSAAEWAEIDGLEKDAVDAPAEFAMEKNAEGKEILVVRRRDLTEPWIYIFGAEYDSGRRFMVNTLLLNPARWSGALPE